MKTINELKAGVCIAIAKSGDNTREFKAIYNDKLKVVFFTIPSHYEVIGYLQD